VSDNEFEDRVGYLENPSILNKGSKAFVKSPISSKGSFKTTKVSENLIEEIRELKFIVKQI
jgi:hypothetical protein